MTRAVQAEHRPRLAPIGDADTGAIADFFHTRLDRQVSREAWLSLLCPPWPGTGPNRGFQLLVGDQVVGAYAAVYSSRGEGDGAKWFCNLAAFCVLAEYRAHSLRLVRALLGQKGFLFTDFSPSGNVPALNERLGFEYFRSDTRLALNLPLRNSRAVSLSTEPEVIEATLAGRDLNVYRDHRNAAACRHAVVSVGERYAYLIYRRDRRKRLRVFATPLYVGGDTALLEEAWDAVAAHLLGRGLVATLAESRVLGFVPHGLGRDLRSARPKMFRGAPACGAERDYLYSELALVEW
ncbi:hypothetical protein [Microbacterium sp. zg-YB36]|uniref:hypothetical protein n=1 Tax=Microbacterium sp. zg-YB36 TaxID=2969407 RepID=UPI00214A93EE|nr:hypothetical protein [Microbacterium sp. zg-YB36]MDL5352376.1 hypothetical protein [Microbacterium sp. zg-YB36]